MPTGRSLPRLWYGLGGLFLVTESNNPGSPQESPLELNGSLQISTEWDFVIGPSEAACCPPAEPVACPDRWVR